MRNQILNQPGAPEKFQNKKLSLKKEVLNFEEACQYTKLNSYQLDYLMEKNHLSFFTFWGNPFFKRIELDVWLHMEALYDFECQAAKEAGTAVQCKNTPSQERDQSTGRP